MAGAGSFNFDGALALARSLWAAADELDSILDDRDESAGVATKHWLGPHRDTFVKGLETSSVDEQALYGLLRSAARNWANAWVRAMNDENQARYDKAVAEADSTLEWLPGFSDRPVSDLAPILIPPSEPDFEPTASLYTNTES